MTAPAVDLRSHDLIDRIQAGDPDAFADLYARHRQRVFMFAYCRVKRREVAEDITQEVFVRALRAVGRFQTVGSVGGWLLMIARNIIVDRFKSKPFQMETLAADPGGQGVAEYRRYFDPEDSALTGLVAADVHAALAELTEEQRQALVLQFWHGMSMVEIGEVMGRNVPAVKSLLLRGRAAMLRQLAGATPC